MRRPRWPYVLMVVVGVALGVAIAGVPTRAQDPPLRVQNVPSTTTSTAPVPAAQAPEPQTPTTAPPRTTTTRRARP
ncbi:MAG: hypothetical protein M3N31_04010 [Actinomycetota bacterium]|nr:hypothetical protein [Actinomycetota bacterium]